MNDAKNVTGSCLCGVVKFNVKKFTRPVTACHCQQCRKISGNFVAATRSKNTELEMISDETLSWYRSSEEAERGFFRVCGGNLFWREIGSDATSIMAGPLDGTTGLVTSAHIYVEDAGDYYELNDDFPRFLQGD